MPLGEIDEMPAIDGQFGYRMYRNTDTYDTVTLAIIRVWRDVWELYQIAEERDIKSHTVCHWMLPETEEFISPELTGGIAVSYTHLTLPTILLV